MGSQTVRHEQATELKTACTHSIHFQRWINTWYTHTHTLICIYSLANDAAIKKYEKVFSSNMNRHADDDPKGGQSEKDSCLTPLGTI